MIKLKSLVTNSEENEANQVASDLVREGYNHHVIYRNQVDVALSTIALSSIRLSEKFNRVMGRSLVWCVIGTKTAEDDKKIRDKVDELRTACGFIR